MRLKGDGSEWRDGRNCGVVAQQTVGTPEQSRMEDTEGFRKKIRGSKYGDMYTNKGQVDAVRLE